MSALRIVDARRPKPAGDQIAGHNASVSVAEGRYFCSVYAADDGYRPHVTVYPDDVPVDAGPYPTADAALLVALMAVCRHLQGRL